MDVVIQAWVHKLEVVGAAAMAVLVAWVPMATLLAKFVRRPDPAAPVWRRLLFDLFVDTPALIAIIEHVGIFGGKWNLPGVPSRSSISNPTSAASKFMRIRREEANVRVGPPPLIALVLVAALVGVAGCAGAKALGRCELGLLPKEWETAIAQLVTALSTPDQDWEADMERAGIGLLEDQKACLGEAVSTYLDTTATKKGQLYPTVVEAHRRLKVYMAKHPAASHACGKTPRQQRLMVAAALSEADALERARASKLP